MTRRDQARGKRCASVRFPEVESAPMSTKANAAKARRIPKLGRHSSGQARVTLNGKVHYCGVRGTTPESDGDRPQLRAGRSASSLNPGEPRLGSGRKLVFTALHTHRLRRPTPLASFSARLHRSLDHPWWRPLGWIGRQPKMDQHSSDLRRITDQAQHSSPRTTGACEDVDQERPESEYG